MANSRWQALLPGICAYVRTQWLAGKPTTINEAAAALGEAHERTGGKGRAASTPVITAFDHLEEQGVAIRDAVRSTRKQRVFAAWNWAGLPLDQQTLRHVVEPYLLAPVPDAAEDAPEEGTDAAEEAPAPAPVQPPAWPQVALPDGRVRRLAPVAKKRRELVVSAVRAHVRVLLASTSVPRSVSSGNYQTYIEDWKRRKELDADQPHRVQYKKLVRS